MGLTISSFPQVDVNDNVNTVSKWGAVHHAILFGMHRQDFSVATFKIPSGSTTLQIQVNGLTGNASDTFTVGDEIYLEVPTGNGIFTITAIINPNTIKIFVGQTTKFNGLGYINHFARLNYFAITQIWGVDEGNVYFLVGESKNTPDNTGRFQVDVASFLKSLVDYQDEFLYDVLNQKDLTLGGKYNITFSENWQGFEGEFSGISNTLLRFFVNAAKQIQDLYGANMGEYVPFNNYDPTDVRAKFLSDFESPTYFPSFPFSLSFIYGDKLAGTETIKHEEQFDVNNGSVSEVTDELDNADVQDVNRLTIRENYPTTTKRIEVWLENDNVESCLQYMQPGYVAIGYIQEICGLPPVDDSPIDDDDSPL